MRQRIAGYDVARALAVIGMVVVNFKLVMGADKAGPHWLLEVAGLLEGRAVATFVVLAGAGMSLRSQGARLANDEAGLAHHRGGLLKRALFLFVVGLLYTPLWPADILHSTASTSRSGRFCWQRPAAGCCGSRARSL